jgi:hypothetical protein
MNLTEQGVQDTLEANSNLSRGDAGRLAALIVQADAAAERTWMQDVETVLHWYDGCCAQLDSIDYALKIGELARRGARATAAAPAMEDRVRDAVQYAEEWLTHLTMQPHECLATLISAVRAGATVAPKPKCLGGNLEDDIAHLERWAGNDTSEIQCAVRSLIAAVRSGVTVAPAPEPVNARLLAAARYFRISDSTSNSNTLDAAISAAESRVEADKGREEGAAPDGEIEALKKRVEQCEIRDRNTNGRLGALENWRGRSTRQCGMFR